MNSNCSFIVYGRSVARIFQGGVTDRDTIRASPTIYICVYVYMCICVYVYQQTQSYYRGMKAHIN